MQQTDGRATAARMQGKEVTSMLECGRMQDLSKGVMQAMKYMTVMVTYEGEGDVLHGSRILED